MVRSAIGFRNMTLMVVVASVLCLCAFWGSSSEAGSIPVSQSTCAQTAANLPIQRYEVGKTSSFKFDQGSNCLELPGNVQVYALLLALPRYTSTYYLRIESILDGRSLVLPYIEMLDAHFNSDREFTYKNMRNRSGTAALTIFMNPVNDNEKYMLIYADPSLVGGRFENIRQSLYMSPYPFFIPEGGESVQTITVSKTGSISVDMIPYNTPQVGDK